MDVVLAVGEGFACEGVLGVIQNSFKGFFNESPGAPILERKACEAVQFL